MSKRIVVFSSFVLIFSIVIAFFYQGLGVDKRNRANPLLNKPMPTFTATLLHDDKPFHSKQLKGQYTVLNVWATWCHTCLFEHAFWVHHSQNKQGYQLVGLNYRDDQAKAREYLRDAKDPYDFVIADASGQVAIDLGVYATPQTFLFDTKGNMIAKHIGPVDDQVWAKTFVPKMKSVQ